MAYIAFPGVLARFETIAHNIFNGMILLSISTCIFAIIPDAKMVPTMSGQAVERSKDTASNADTGCDTNSIISSSLITDVSHSSLNHG